jgi:hypothetical protein
MGIKGELKVLKILLGAYYNVHVYNGVMYNGCIKAICNSYLKHIKKYQPYIKLHMYATHILKFYKKNYI